MVATREDAEATLRPYIDRFFHCVTDAVYEYQQMPSEKIAKFSTRTRANIINDFMVHNAKTIFADTKGIEFYVERGQFRLHVHRRLILRLKKFDDRLRSSNIPTLQAQEYLRQLAMDLPGVPTPTKLILGYQWNILQTDIAGVFVVCPVGARNEWVIEVQGTDSPSALEMPTGAPRPGNQPRRIVAKQSASEKEGQGGSG